LRAERNFVSAVLDTISAMVVVMDREGRIERFNRACEEITGYDFKELAGKQIWDILLAPEEKDAVLEIFSHLQDGEFPKKFTNSWITRSGDRRVIDWSNTGLLDANGEVEHIIATGIDLTERKMMEERIRIAQLQLAESSRQAAIGDLASGVAHHINNPLTTIIAEAQILLNEISSNTSVYDSIKAIEQAGWRVQGAVQQLLDFSRPPTNTFEMLPINQTIKTALELFDEQIKANGVHIYLELGPKLPKVSGNAQKLKSLWTNLLVLAKDGTNDGQPHTISITSMKENNSIVVEIRDDGKPIPQDELKDLHEPNFFRSLGGRGSGIEINICQEIVRQHNGDFTISSEPSQGIIFHVNIPLEVSNEAL
jgi:PAS domain S-box-containing protein